MQVASPGEQLAANGDQESSPMRDSTRPAAAPALEKRYTMKEAAQVFFHGRVTDKTLLREYTRHNIPLEFIGGKYFCTASDIDALSKASKRIPGSEGDMQCQDVDSRPASTSGAPEVTVEPPGSFSTERRKLARAQAKMSLMQLRKPSPPTSPPTTGRRVVPIGRVNSSSRKS
jgi:hypothetical protein